MTDLRAQIIRRARALAGVPFRPQGRDPATGLDCVGVVAWAMGIHADAIRRDYRLRGPAQPELEGELSRFLSPIDPIYAEPSDVLLCKVGPDQMHLAIWCGQSFVHADARLRRVVETPGLPGWPVLRAFRAERKIPGIS